MVVALFVLSLALTALATILIATVGATREDGLRTRATQLAQGQLEYLRTLPWNYVGLTSAGGASGCYNGELVRVLPSGDTSLVDSAPSLPAGFTAARHVTWSGVACDAAQPSYGTLDLFATVSWSVSGVSRSVTVTGSRAPLVSEATPNATFSLSPSPTPSPTATSASPSTSPTTSSASPSASTTAPSANPTPTPSFGTTFTSPNPVQICDEHGNRDISATAATFTVNVYGASASDAVTLSWYDNASGSIVGPYLMTASTPQGSYVPFSYTVAAGTAFNAGDTYTFTVSVPATASHLAATFTETVNVAKGNGNNTCR